jgi:hypothetical protein
MKERRMMQKNQRAAMATGTTSTIPRTTTTTTATPQTTNAKVLLSPSSLKREVVVLVRVSHQMNRSTSRFLPMVVQRVLKMKGKDHVVK